MRMKRTLSMMAGIAAGLLALSGCSDGGSAAGGPAEKPKIWYISPLTSYPAWAESMKKFVDEAPAGGYLATAVGPTKPDTTTNINQMEQAISDGAKGIIFCNTDPKAFASGIQQAKDAGVVVVTIGCVDDVSDFSIGTDNKKFGDTAADNIAKNAGQDAVVGIVSTDQTTPNQVAQVEAFKARAKEKYPNMKIGAWESDKSDTSIAAQKITSMIQGTPAINAVWCVEGQCPGALATGLAEAGKKPGQVYTLGIDTVATTLDAIKQGWLGSTLNQCWFDATKLATSLITKSLAGDHNPTRSWGIGVDEVGKDQIPYKGCPADAIPTP